MDRICDEDLLFVLILDSDCPISQSSLTHFVAFQQTDHLFSRKSIAIDYKEAEEFCNKHGVFALPTLMVFKLGEPLVFLDRTEVPSRLYSGPISEQILKEITTTMSFILSNLEDYHCIRME
ncbi:hypothetical protein P9112_002633 [Eukaryota sp. TZLM1-RC]